MNYSLNLFESILDSSSEHIVVIDRWGAILYVNRAWIEFGVANGLGAPQWIGKNYFEACEGSAAAGDTSAAQAFESIRQVINKQSVVSYVEYPCHSLTEQRWFIMRTTALRSAADTYLISHQNITERKLIEEKIRELTLTDELTGLANRRHFDRFLADEWRRAIRMKTPISLLFLDIDHFKRFNDQHGHIAGDECLKQIAAVMKLFGKRPGDLCARYGGEEFAIVLGNTEGDAARNLGMRLLKAIQDSSFNHAPVTASVGLSVMNPERGSTEARLIELADHALYAAKNLGRNQLCISDDNGNVAMGAKREDLHATQTDGLEHSRAARS